MSIREQSQWARAVLVGLAVVVVMTVWVLLVGGPWWSVAIPGLVAGAASFLAYRLGEGREKHHR